MQDISNVNDFGLIFTVVMAVLLFTLPRKYAHVPLLMTALYLTQGQVVLVGPFHFTMIRVVLLIGWLRSATRGELISIRLNIIDKLFIAYVASAVIIKTLLWQTTEIFINRLGFAYDAIGCYFIFRVLVRDLDDISRLIKHLAILIIPLAITMLTEASTGRNIFSIFGGVDEYSELREGKVRCQGSFRHPILAGTFGATLVPLFVGIWIKKGTSRVIGTLGIISATAITYTATSSGPLMSYVFAIIGLGMWYLRSNMRIIRWGILASLLLMHMLMQAPVWFIIARISDILGGSGWHRSEIIDQAINHFDEWWLLGTKSTAHWMATTLAVSPDSADITNNFVGVGVSGGLITLSIYILVIVYCFKSVGEQLKYTKDAEISTRFLLWSLGVALFAHIVSFMSVGYFDQIVVFWYLLLASISTICISEKKLKLSIKAP
jgi:hypothetical protein